MTIQTLPLSSTSPRRSEQVVDIVYPNMRMKTCLHHHMVFHNKNLFTCIITGLGPRMVYSYIIIQTYIHQCTHPHVHSSNNLMILPYIPDPGLAGMQYLQAHTYTYTYICPHSCEQTLTQTLPYSRSRYTLTHILVKTPVTLEGNLLQIQNTDVCLTTVKTYLSLRSNYTQGC